MTCVINAALLTKNLTQPEIELSNFYRIINRWLTSGKPISGWSHRRLRRVNKPRERLYTARNFVPLRLGDVLEEIVETLGVVLRFGQQPLVLPGHHDSREILDDIWVTRSFFATLLIVDNPSSRLLPMWRHHASRDPGGETLRRTSDFLDERNVVLSARPAIYLLPRIRLSLGAIQKRNVFRSVSRLCWQTCRATRLMRLRLSKR